MRTALIAALARTDDGNLRAELPLAGRSVLAWQVALMRALGAERILCLCHRVEGEVLRLQQAVEAEGATFHALRGFAAVPALVRAEDELIIVRDGLLPDAALVDGLIAATPRPQPWVACLPVDSPLAARHPTDFEWIDSARRWAGMLVMRGAAVQQLADFPADADPVSVLLRLALQAGTPCRDLTAPQLASQTWLMADGNATVTAHEQDLIARAGSTADLRAPFSAVADMLVRHLAPRGLVQGTRVAAGIALALLLAGGGMAAMGASALGLATAAAGSLASGVAAAYAGLVSQLRREPPAERSAAMVSRIADGLASAVLLLALMPQSLLTERWAPLALLGPVAIGLARLAARNSGSAGAAFWGDRTAQLAALALAAAFGLLPAATALFASAALGTLLLRAPED